MQQVIQKLMFWAVAFGGLMFSVGARHFTVDRFFLIAFFIPIILILAGPFLGRNRILLVRPFRAGWLFAAWGLSMLVSTALTSDPGAHMGGVIISLEPILLYYLFASQGTKLAVIQQTSQAILWYLAVAGVFVYLLWIAGHPAILSRMIDRNRINLTLIEPNIFGATIGYLLIIAIPSYKRTARYYALYAFGLIALIFCQSRIPYLSFVVSIAIYFAFQGYFRSSGAKIKLVLGIAVAAFMGVLAAGLLQKTYQNNFDRSNSFRILTLVVAWKRYLAHPIFGNGALDFGLKARDLMSLGGSTNIQDVWICNMFMSVAHDTGTVGLLIYTIFLVLLIVRAYRLVKKNRSKQHCAYLAGFILLIICSQSTTMHLTPLFGIAAGLLGSGIEELRSEPSAKATVSSLGPARYPGLVYKHPSRVS